MSSNNKIILKRSSVVGKKPTADQLDYGEISLNYADGEVYYKSSKNEIKALGEQYASEIETLKSGKLDKTETAYAAKHDPLGHTFASEYIVSLEFSNRSSDNKLCVFGNTADGGAKSGVIVPDFVGATNSSSGKSGIVPAPASNDRTMFLRGDGKWATLTPTFDNEGNRISDYVRSVQLGNGGNGVISIEVADGQGLAVTTGTNFAATAKSPGMVAVGDNITLNASTHAISLTKENVVSALGYTPPETGAAYSAGTGLALDEKTNTFSNSGVRSVVSTSNNGFEIDTGGTKTSIVISNVPSANQATMDAKGNVFTDTYATKTDINGVNALIEAEVHAVTVRVDHVETTYATNESPLFTGVPTAPTAAEGTNTTQIATTAFVQSAVKSFAPDLSGYAQLSGSTFTGSVTIPTLTVTERVKLPTIIEQDTEITESRTISNMSVSTHYVELGDDVTVTVDDDATWVIK